MRRRRVRRYRLTCALLSPPPRWEAPAENNGEQAAARHTPRRNGAIYGMAPPVNPAVAVRESATMASETIFARGRAWYGWLAAWGAAALLCGLVSGAMAQDSRLAQ